MVEFVDKIKRNDDGVTEHYFMTDEIDALYDDYAYSDNLDEDDVQVVGHEIKVEVTDTGDVSMFIGMVVEDRFGDTETRNYEEIDLYGSGVIVDTFLELVGTLHDLCRNAFK